jgi:hypothetical protein
VVAVLVSDEHSIRALEDIGDLGSIQQAAWVDNERPIVIIQPNAGVPELRQAHVTPLR